MKALFPIRQENLLTVDTLVFVVLFRIFCCIFLLFLKTFNLCTAIKIFGCQSTTSIPSRNHSISTLFRKAQHTKNISNFNLQRSQPPKHNK